jgi:hypothetical protein
MHALSLTLRSGPSRLGKARYFTMANEFWAAAGFARNKKGSRITRLPHEFCSGKSAK